MDSGQWQVVLGVLALGVTIAITVGTAIWGLSSWLHKVRAEVKNEAVRINDETRAQAKTDREEIYRHLHDCDEDRRTTTREFIVLARESASAIKDASAVNLRLALAVDSNTQASRSLTERLDRMENDRVTELAVEQERRRPRT